MSEILIAALLAACVLEACVISRQSQVLDELSDRLFEATQPIDPVTVEPVWDYTRATGWREEDE